MYRMNARAGQPHRRRPLNWDGISALAVNVLFWALIAILAAVAIPALTRFGG